MKNNYLFDLDSVEGMKRVSGVSGLKEAREVANEQDGEVFLPGLRGLMRHKYGDLILLCSVVAGFAVLMVVSTLL